MSDTPNKAAPRLRPEIEKEYGENAWAIGHRYLIIQNINAEMIAHQKRGHELIEELKEAEKLEKTHASS